MSFKPVKLAVIFSALCGASLAISGVALADSSTPSALSNSNATTELTIVNGKASPSEGSTTSQSSSEVLQTTFSTSTTDTTSSGSTNTSSIKETTAGSNATGNILNGSNPADQPIISTTGDSSRTTDKPITTDVGTLVASREGESSTSQVTPEIKLSIDSSMARAQSNQSPKSRAAVVQDSGGVAAASGAVPTPAHPAPEPVRGLGEFTALLSNVIMPGFQFNGTIGQGLVAFLVVQKAQLPLLLLIGLVVSVSLFIVNLRQSGFSHAARGDVPMAADWGFCSLNNEFGRRGSDDVWPAHFLA